jgi:chromate transporter
MAALLVAVMFLISLAEHRGPELFARVKSAVHPESREAPAACPVLPLGNLRDSLDAHGSMASQFGAICTDLFSSFSALSVCAFGGEETILPCMKNASVVHHSWMTQREFVDLFSMSFLVPGPSMLSALVGLKACSSFGLGGRMIGASVAVLALFLPSILVVLLVAHYWNRLKGWPWRPTIGRAMLLIASGALSAALMFITETAITSSTSAAVAAASVLALILTDINPVLIVSLSAIAGFLFLG